MNEKYVGGDLLQRQIALASQFLLHPLKDGDQLSNALFKEAMINLKAMIQRRSDNPASYAASQCAKLLGEGQALGISVLPTMEEAETITLAQVSEAYEKMIREDRIDIFVEGQVDLIIFFSDPLTAQPHDPDVKALLRIAQVYDIPIANNKATADFLMTSSYINEEYNHEVINFRENILHRAETL